MLADAVLVTGAAHRVGLAVALHLHEAGYRVLAHVHHERPEMVALRERGITILSADFADVASVQSLADQIAAQCSSLRGIVHNASAFAKTAPDMSTALVQFEQFFAVHMRAPWLLNTLLTPQLQACTAAHADVVHITDIYADNPNPLFDVYCASKAGLANLSLSFAKKLAPKVKVNAIQPGPILFKDWHSEATKAAVLGETLLGREGGAEAIALAVASVFANPYQTGAVIAVDGGRRLA